MALMKRQAQGAVQSQVPAATPEPAQQLVGVVDGASLPADTPLERLYRDRMLRLRPTMLAVARLRVRPEHAEEVFQRVALDFWKRWPHLTLAQQSDAAILKATANQAIKLYKYEHLRRTVALPDDDWKGAAAHLAAVDPSIEIEVQNLIDVTIEKLTPLGREVLLRKIAEYTYDEIAAEVGITRDQARTEFQKAQMVAWDVFTRAGFKLAPPRSRQALQPSTEASR